ncbi:MAG TPA: hypothetical protein VFQ28_05550 [Gaiella sp.]|nr:hypothetical protein [Gaiella sp.]
MSRSRDLEWYAATSVDDVWLREWAAEGIAALERLLAAHAAFDDYLRTRQDSDDGDRADED